MSVIQIKIIISINITSSQRFHHKAVDLQKQKTPSSSSSTSSMYIQIVVKKEIIKIEISMLKTSETSFPFLLAQSGLQRKPVTKPKSTSNQNKKDLQLFFLSPKSFNFDKIYHPSDSELQPLQLY